MSKKLLCIFWAGLFILCAACGFIPEPAGIPALALTTLSLLFFLPPACLLYLAGKDQDTDTAKLIRNLSALSLILTLVLLILNFLTVFGTERLGQILHHVLIIVSSPMICSGHWGMSLFLWACLLIVSKKQLKR